jgi:hypothetical protein
VSHREIPPPVSMPSKCSEFPALGAEAADYTPRSPLT